MQAEPPRQRLAHTGPEARGGRCGWCCHGRGGLRDLGHPVHAGVRLRIADRRRFRSWWLFGDNINTYSQRLDHTVVPDAEAFQAFFAIFVVFGAFFAALLAGSVIERVKTRSLVVLVSVFAGW